MPHTHKRRVCDHWRPWKNHVSTHVGGCVARKAIGEPAQHPHLCCNYIGFAASLEEKSKKVQAYNHRGGQNSAWKGSLVLPRRMIDSIENPVEHTEAPIGYPARGASGRQPLSVCDCKRTNVTIDGLTSILWLSVHQALRRGLSKTLQVDLTRAMPRTIPRPSASDGSLSGIQK